MQRKRQFLSAQILAPGDKFTLKDARRVPEEKPPALELEAALQKCKPSDNRELESGRREVQLSMGHALRTKSAHYWLELGEVDQALLELGALSTTATNHPLAVKARVAVLQAFRRQHEAQVLE